MDACVTHRARVPGKVISFAPHFDPEVNITPV